MGFWQQRAVAAAEHEARRRAVDEARVRRGRVAYAQRAMEAPPDLSRARASVAHAIASAAAAGRAELAAAIEAGAASAELPEPGRTRVGTIGDRAAQERAARGPLLDRGPVPWYTDAREPPELCEPYVTWAHRRGPQWEAPQGFAGPVVSRAAILPQGLPPRPITADAVARRARALRQHDRTDRQGVTGRAGMI